MADYDAYLICTAPRSGSTLLCSMLTKTGIAGAPASYFHRPSVAAWAKALDLPDRPDQSAQDQLSQIFSEAQIRGRADSEIFGCRIQSHSLTFLRRQLAVLAPDAPDDAARLRDLFGRILFIHLSREDKIAQAVSYIRAQQSGLWHRAADGTELERLSQPEPLRYDAAAIAAQYRDMIAADDMWNSWFQRLGIRPLRLSYETLAETPHHALATVLRDLGCAPNVATGAPIPLARLADETSQIWCARFRAALEAGEIAPG